jgi:plasmid stabilization system protein ParE
MKSRFVLSGEAVEDLASIWRYIQTQSSTEIADRVESTIRDG